MASLTGCMIVKFSSNRLSGKIPDAVVSKTTLFHLLLGINDLSGKIPDAVASMTRSVFLFASYTVSG